MAAFDVATTISEFVADSARASLELPHMTTGQRKNAKKLLEQYPDLRCESYGFGTERQLHLFKTDMVDAQKAVDVDHHFLAPQPVSIKNTFIDGLAVLEPEPVVFRSLQQASDRSSLDLAAIAKIRAESASPDRSTVASSEECAKESPSTSPRYVTLPVVDLQVRNTFIQFESTHMDERAVQSMPHGMFRHCLRTEASQGAIASDMAAPAFAPKVRPRWADEEVEKIGSSEVEPMFVWPSTPADGPQGKQALTLGLGALVVVEGLLKAPAFNGRSAVVQGFDEETGRYSILLVSPDGCQQAKVKGENLRVVLPCP